MAGSMVINGDANTAGFVRTSAPLTQQVFATFCGLGIHSVMNYEAILKSNAKQSVALEVRRRLI